MPEREKTKHKSTEYIFDYTFFMYNLSGFGILENSENRKKFLYSIYYKIFHALYIFMIGALVVDAYLVRNDKKKLFFNLCLTIVSVGSLVKIWVFLGKLNILVELRRRFRENFNLPYVGQEKAHKEIKIESSRQHVLNTKSLTSMAVPMTMIWIIFPLVDPTSKERKYCIPFPFFKNAQTPIFEIIYAFHVFWFVHFVSNIMHNDLLIIGSLVRICEQFDILIYNISKIKKIYEDVDFEKLVPDYEDGKRKTTRDFIGPHKRNKSEINRDDSEKLRFGKDWQRKETLRIMRQNIVHHRCILQQLEDINYTYGGQLFIQVTVGALVISVVAFDLIVQSRQFNVPVFQQLLYVTAVSTDIFMLCYYGSQIEEKSEKAAEALYDTPWYDMDISSQRIFFFMITKCRRLPKVKARFVFTMNLGTYESLMKTAYNVMALLNESQ